LAAMRAEMDRASGDCGDPGWLMTLTAVPWTLGSLVGVCTLVIRLDDGIGGLPFLVTYALLTVGWFAVALAPLGLLDWLRERGEAKPKAKWILQTLRLALAAILVAGSLAVFIGFT